MIASDCEVWASFCVHLLCTVKSERQTPTNSRHRQDRLTIVYVHVQFRSVLALRLLCDTGPVQGFFSIRCIREHILYMYTTAKPPDTRYTSYKIHIYLPRYKTVPSIKRRAVR